MFYAVLIQAKSSEEKKDLKLGQTSPEVQNSH